MFIHTEPSLPKRSSDEAGDSRDERLAQLLDEYLCALERGESPRVDQLTADCPSLAADLRKFGQSLELLHHTTQGLRGDVDDSSAKTSFAAKRLGDFEIGAEIGRGGMGVIYEARQISLDRRVALKVLPLAAMWDQKQIARFRNEAQAAAQLHHPNIVPVFAVGQERGIHYYAMQLIDGQSLDVVLSELRRHATPRQASAAAEESTVRRLSATKCSGPVASKSFSHQYLNKRHEYWRGIAKLGAQAAEALHEAHEYGVIHRDVKPSNLMLDDRGKLWVTDFGLARVQQSPSVTMTGDVVGTLRYMSPEQAAGRQSLVDARTDVYALGATLYEMLTLQPAFPGEDRRIVQKSVEEIEPVSPRVVNPEIPADLETIVLKAMSKAPQDRYLTAGAMADDLNRFLAGQPTLARRPTLVDRSAKWLWRRRKLAAAAAVMLLLLSTVSTVGAVLLARERAEKTAALAMAQRNLERAETNFRQARQVVDRFGIQFASDLEGRPGAERLRQQLLIEARNYYEDFAEQIGETDDLQKQLASTLLKTGVVTAKLGAEQQALEHYRKAQTVLAALIDANPEDAESRSQLALSRNNTALLSAAQGDTEAALQQYRQAIVEQQRLLASNPQNSAFAAQLAKSHVNLGVLLGELDQAESAVEQLKEGVEVFERLTHVHPESAEHARSLAVAYINLSFVEHQVDAAAAEKSARTAVDILETACESPRVSDECLADLAFCHSNLSSILGNDGRLEEAAKSSQRAVVLYESLIRRSPEVVGRRSKLAATLNNLALLRIRQGDVGGAAEAFGYANRLYARLLLDFPNHVPYYSGWAALLNNQALALADVGRYDDAVNAYQQATTALDEVAKRVEDPQVAADVRSRVYFNCSQSYQAVGRYDDAAQLALKRRQLWQGDGDRLFSVAVELAEILQNENGSLEDRDHVVAEVVTTLNDALNDGHAPRAPLQDDGRFAFLRDYEPAQELCVKWRACLIDEAGSQASTRQPLRRRSDVVTE